MGIWLKTRELADHISETIIRRVDEWKHQGIQPAIATILVQGDPASEYYALAKEKLARKLGVQYHLMVFPAEISEEQLLEIIEVLNEDMNIHGIMLELPMPKHISVNKLSNTISPVKDVDGISAVNKLACLTGETGLYPATPQSCVRILQHYGYPLQGKHVVLVGRGETVGRPLMQLLLRENATLTVCHSYTTDLAGHIAKADILITAAGRKGLISPAMVHPSLVVIDAGINETEDGIIGDVDRDVIEAVEAVTPVPGGVGTLTTVLLFENVLKAMDLQHITGGEPHGRI